jgi:hypothetical protein
VDEAFNKVTGDVMHAVLAAEERERGGPGTSKKSAAVRVDEGTTQVGGEKKKSSGSCC